MADKLKIRLDPATLPPSVRDSFTVALMQAAGKMLDEADLRRVLAELVDTAPAVSLPALVRELSLEDIIEPGMAEHVIRRLLKRFYELHAKKGYIDGVRLVLSLLGAKCDWTQWFEMSPKGAAGTHRVSVYPQTAVFDAQDTLLDPRTRPLVRRAISNYKRKSQFIGLYLGLSHQAAIRPALVMRQSKRIRISGPGLEDQSYTIPTWAGGGFYAIRRCRIDAKGSIYG